PGGRGASQLAGRGLPADDQSFHVNHVPNYFRPGTEGHGREDEDRGIVLSNGDSGRRGADEVNGNASIADCVSRARGLLHRRGAVRMVVRRGERGRGSSVEKPQISKSAKRP